MNFTIRAIAPVEAEDYYSLVNEVKDEGKFLFASIRIPLENMRKYIAQHYESSNPVLGAFDDKKELLGWIDINRSNIEELAHWRHPSAFHALPDHHGSGHYFPGRTPYAAG